MQNVKKNVIISKIEYSLSDIDLAVQGGDIPRFRLDMEEETSTLLKFDIVDLEMQDELRESIYREGKVLYEKVWEFSTWNCRCGKK